MFDDIKAIKEMQRIQAGGIAKLSKSQIIIGAFNLKDLVHGLDKDTANKCIAFYDEMRKQKSKEMYDAVKLLAVVEEMQNSFDEIINKPSTKSVFPEILDAVENYLLEEPFRNMDDISYGFREVCIFAAAEYLAWFWLKYEDTAGAKWYKASMIERSDEKTAELLMCSFFSVQEDIEKDLRLLHTLNRENLDKTNILLYLCAFKAIKPLGLHKYDQEKFSKIIEQGDFILEYFDSGGLSDGSDFMDNFINLENFLVSYFKNIIMKQVRSNKSI